MFFRNLACVFVFATAITPNAHCVAVDSKAYPSAPELIKKLNAKYGFALNATLDPMRPDQLLLHFLPDEGVDGVFGRLNPMGAGFARGVMHYFSPSHRRYLEEYGFVVVMENLTESVISIPTPQRLIDIHRERRAKALPISFFEPVLIGHKVTDEEYVGYLKRREFPIDASGDDFSGYPFLFEFNGTVHDMLVHFVNVASMSKQAADDFQRAAETENASTIAERFDRITGNASHFGQRDKSDDGLNLSRSFEDGQDCEDALTPVVSLRSPLARRLR